MGNNLEKESQGLPSKSGRDYYALTCRKNFGKRA